MRKITFILLFFHFFASNAQFKYNNQWRFGYGIGINFNTTSASAAYGQTNSIDGGATMSDKDGNLLFYTEATTVWNKNNQIMPNGAGLLGGQSATQSCIIVPFIADCNKYYVFTTDDHVGASNLLRYSVVDMSLNGGLGDIVSGQKNLILSNNIAEKMTIISHQNGQDFWLVTHEFNNNIFKAYLINSTGISSTPINSAIGPVINNRSGALKPNHAGNTLIMCGLFENIVYKFDFNNSNGTVSNPLNLVNAIGLPFGANGADFSSNDSLLYIAFGWGTSRLIQINIFNLSFSTLALRNGNYIYGGVQLGPDKKIYIARTDSAFVSCVEFPDIHGVSCNYINKAIEFINGKKSASGIPTFIPYNWQGQSSFIPNIQLNPNTTNLCTGDTVYFNATGGGNYVWNSTASLSGTTINNPYSVPSDTTLYILTVTNAANCTAIDTVQINVIPFPSIQLNPNTTDLCTGDTVYFNATGGGSYMWSSTATLSGSTINNPYSVPADTTLYILTVTNVANCNAKDSVQINVTPSPVIQLNPNTTNLCMGDTVYFAASSAVNYTWSSPNATLSSYNTANPYSVPADTSMYILTASNSGSCTATDTVQVNVASLPVITLTASADSVCSADTLYLNASGGGTYTWTATNATLSDNTVPNPYALLTGNTQIVLNVTNAAGCKAMKNIGVTYTPNPALTLTASDTVLCRNGSVRLLASGATTYVWREVGLLDNNLINNPLATPDTPDRYFVVTGYTNQCSSTDSIHIQQSAVTALTNADTTIFTYYPISLFLHNSSENADTYQWTYNGTELSTSAETSVELNTTGVHIFILRSINSNTNCEDSDTLVVTVNSGIYIPNVITPNGDQTNEYFEILSLAQPWDVEIYDRWGILVYSNTDYTAQWRADNLSDGMYYYIIRNMPQRNLKYKGWIEVIR